MAHKRLSMRKIREVLRLYLVAQMTLRAIARSVRSSPSTVGEYVRRAEAAGLHEWAAVEALDEVALERRLYPPANVVFDGLWHLAGHDRFCRHSR